MPEFILTAPPPSVNAMYANAKCGRVKTSAYRKWISGEMKSLLAQRAQPVQWPVAITLLLPMSARGDADNRLKSAQDLLVRAGVIPSDSKKYVVDIRAAYHGLPHATIWVRSRSTSAARKLPLPSDKSGSTVAEPADG